ncbi:MAG: hypothetical protein PHN38_09950, partial [Sulfurospirillaceae bacterium]|nr:hypothetical protein [Sulfurospirillaceae bacterium]
MKSKQLISIFLSISLLLNQTLYAASITVDAVAPSANKATLLSAPNGVPIVNIVAPTASGL